MDVPEDIVLDWSLRYLRSATATGTPWKPFSVLTILLCMAVCVCSGVHIFIIGPNSQVPRGQPPLLYDDINVILRMVV